MKSNEELMILIQSGSQEAFNAIYSRFKGVVYGYLGKKVKGDDRDELLQEVFLKLYQKAHLYQAEYPFKPWFFTLIRNLIIDYYRARRIDYIALEVDELVAPEDPLQSEHGDLSGLDYLDENEQNLLYQKFVEGRGYKELEEHFELKASSLRKRVSRLIKKIRSREGQL